MGAEPTGHTRLSAFRSPSEEAGGHKVDRRAAKDRETGQTIEEKPPPGGEVKGPICPTVGQRAGTTRG